MNRYFGPCFWDCQWKASVTAFPFRRRWWWAEQTRCLSQQGSVQLSNRRGDGTGAEFSNSICRGPACARAVSDRPRLCSPHVWCILWASLQQLARIRARIKAKPLVCSALAHELPQAPGEVLGPSSCGWPAGWSDSSHFAHALWCPGRITSPCSPWQHPRCLKVLWEEQWDSLWPCPASTAWRGPGTSTTRAGAEGPARIPSAAEKFCTPEAAGWDLWPLRGTSCVVTFPLGTCPWRSGRRWRRMRGCTAAVWRSRAPSTTSRGTFGWSWPKVGLGTLGTQPAGRNHPLHGENLESMCSFFGLFWPKVFFPNYIFFEGGLQPVANLSHIQSAV